MNSRVSLGDMIASLRFLVEAEWIQVERFLAISGFLVFLTLQ